jgi:hypothetical protein
MERIHIVGAGPRTGTTLLAECMIACFEIDAFEAHEAPLSRHRKNVDIYLTKNPVDLNIVGPRLLVDQHLHVLAMLRDPRDVIASKHAHAPDRYWAPLRFWRRHVQIIRRLKWHRRFVLIRYEELVQKPDSVQKMLMCKMPFLKQKARFSEFHNYARPSPKSVRALGSLRPIDGDSIGNWRNHLARVAGQIRIHGPISRDLIAFGYENDESWLTMLHDVLPDLSPSQFPEQLNQPTWRLRSQCYKAAAKEAAKIGVARLLGVPLV